MDITESIIQLPPHTLHPLRGLKHSDLDAMHKWTLRLSPEGSMLQMLQFSYDTGSDHSLMKMYCTLFQFLCSYCSAEITEVGRVINVTIC